MTQIKCKMKLIIDYHEIKLSITSLIVVWYLFSEVRDPQLVNINCRRVFVELFAPWLGTAADKGPVHAWWFFDAAQISVLPQSRLALHYFFERVFPLKFWKFFWKALVNELLNWKVTASAFDLEWVSHELDKDLLRSKLVQAGRLTQEN